MAIKKKAVLTDDTTLPTLPNPLFTNIIALPFGLAFNLPNQNVRPIPVLPDPTATTRPSQNVGFDISITNLTQPRPMYLNDINGIFNLYSNAISDFFGGLVPQFDPRYIAIRQQLNAIQPKPTPAPTPLIAGYPAGAILFSNAPNPAWYQSLIADNQVSPATPATTPTWQQITLPYLPVIGGTTNVPATSINFIGATVQANATNANNAIVTIQAATPPLQLYQQGRLCGNSGLPYDDTTSNSSSTLYFTPTENGNLLSLWNGNAWVTQSFNELSLPIVVNQGTLQPLSTPSIATGTNPQGVAIHPNSNFVYVTNSSAGSISIYPRATNGSLTTPTTFTPAGTTPSSIAITPDARSIYWTVSNSASAGIYQGTLNANGTITATGTSIATNGQGNGIVISPESNFVYICGGSGNNFVYQFIRNADNSLSALTPNKLATGLNPTAISLSSDGNNIYVTNGSDRTVSQYSRSTSGLLSLIGTTAVIPSTTPTGIIVSPDGLNVYVTNQGTNSISQYSRATDTGLLTLIVTTTPVATGNTPKAIIISPDGSFVYVINTIANSSGIFTISQYSRNSSTGLLTALGTPTVTTGTAPTAISISPNGNNVYVTNNLGSAVNGTVSEYLINRLTNLTLIQDAPYDIYVGKNVNGILTLATDTFNGNRTKLPNPNNNGKWVNNVVVGGIPQYQALLLGSINVAGGVVQSWYGNRSIWNLYNQVALGLLATQNTLNVDGQYRWQWANSWYHNQNSNGTDGTGRFTFLIDPLYIKQLTCQYNGAMYLGALNDGGATGIILNTSVSDSSNTSLPIVNTSSGSLTASATTTGNLAPFSANYSYQYNNLITSTLPNGLNFIQKIEVGLTRGLFSDSSGLTATYYG